MVKRSQGVPVIAVGAPVSKKIQKQQQEEVEKKQEKTVCASEEKLRRKDAGEGPSSPSRDDERPEASLISQMTEAEWEQARKDQEEREEVGRVVYFEIFSGEAREGEQQQQKPQQQATSSSSRSSAAPPRGKAPSSPRGDDPRARTPSAFGRWIEPKTKGSSLP